MASPKNEYFVENERTEVAEEATETKNGKQTSNARYLHTRFLGFSSFNFFFSSDFPRSAFLSAHFTNQ